MSNRLAVQLDFKDSDGGQSTPTRRGGDTSPIPKSSRNSSRSSSPLKAVSFRIDTSTVEAIAVEKVATPSPIPVTTSPSTRASSGLTSSGKGEAEESKRLSSRIDQIASSSSPSPFPSSKRFSAKAATKVASTRSSLKKSGSTEELITLPAKNTEARDGGGEPSSSQRNTDSGEVSKTQESSSSAGTERRVSERSMLSGKLSPRGGAAGEELEVTESAASRAEHVEKAETWQGLRGLYNFFFAPPADIGPPAFSLDGTDAPPVATRRVVLLGRDDVGKAYLQRKMLCTVGELMGAGHFSRTGVRAASKMSTTGECAFVEVTDVPLEELEEELESENSYLFRRLLPSADAIVLAFDANELDEITTSQDYDDDDARADYGGAACPSLVFLQDLYDTLLIEEVLAPDTIKVVVGNVGYSHKIRPEDLPQQTIAAAKSWAAQHEDEGLFYASLAVGNDRDVRIISKLLEV